MSFKQLLLSPPTTPSTEEIFTTFSFVDSLQGTSFSWHLNWLCRRCSLCVHAQVTSTLTSPFHFDTQRRNFFFIRLACVSFWVEHLWQPSDGEIFWAILFVAFDIYVFRFQAFFFSLLLVFFRQAMSEHVYTIFSPCKVAGKFHYSHFFFAFPFKGSGFILFFLSSNNEPLHVEGLENYMELITVTSTKKCFASSQSNAEVFDKFFFCAKILMKFYKTSSASCSFDIFLCN